MKTGRFRTLEPAAMSSAVMIGSVTFVLANVIALRFQPEQLYALVLGVPVGGLLAIPAAIFVYRLIRKVLRGCDG